ncbi:hypothetical protein BC938DRAFT_471448 [Jimgerdemannia flammicorona]|uniref:ABC transmembrane type-1 domain-containing protein n=1 Tax=Jimgerdemannia flammicorona TaxID=994334 RepID=A0A433QUQ4_9FUNG|nr:hypothetical protein BC938DRAFT_471448 [Jimgerdemannia flammicorona]
MVSPFCPTPDDFVIVPPTLSLVFLLSTAYFRRLPFSTRQPETDPTPTSSSTPADSPGESNGHLSNPNGKKAAGLTDPTPVPRATLLVLSIYALNVLVLCSFFADVPVLVSSATFREGCLSSLLYYDLASGLAWILNLIGLYFESNRLGKWGILQHGFWFGATLLESVEFGDLAGRFFATPDGGKCRDAMGDWFHSVTVFHTFTTRALRKFLLSSPSVQFNHDKNRYTSTKQHTLNIWELIHYYLFALRVLLLTLLCLCLLFKIRRSLRVYLTDEESASLTNGTTNTTASSYGTFTNAAETATVTPTDASDKQARLEQSAFVDFVPKVKQLLPFLYPKKDTKLQFVTLVCIGLLLVARALNLLIPVQMKKVVDSLAGDHRELSEFFRSYFAWDQIAVLFALRFIQGSGGIDSLRSYLWIPISQYTTREISIKILSHLHSLSLEYHINRKTGEVLRIVDRGTSSVQNVLQGLLFQLFPSVLDALIGVFYFRFAYGWSFGLVIFVVIIFYAAFTIGLTEQRTKYSRETNALDQDARAKAVDSLLNYETVKYYTAEEFEIERTSFHAHFPRFQLGILGWIYTSIQRSFVDMEKMLELLKVEPSVKDPPDNKALVVTEGNIVFDNVSFWYDPRHQALSNVSFTIPKGATVALVGPSGGGYVQNMASEVDHPAPTLPLLRRDLGSDPGGWAGYTDGDAAVSAAKHWGRTAGHIAVQRYYFVSGRG